MAQHAFNGFEIVDPTGHGFHLWRDLVSNPARFPDELKRETKRNDIIQPFKKLAACEMKYTHDRNIVSVPNYRIADLNHTVKPVCNDHLYVKLITRYLFSYVF